GLAEVGAGGGAGQDRAGAGGDVDRHWTPAGGGQGDGEVGRRVLVGGDGIVDRDARLDVVVIDGARGGGVRQGGMVRVGEGQGEGLVVLVEDVTHDRHPDHGCQAARGEGEGPARGGLRGRRIRRPVVGGV